MPRTRIPLPGVYGRIDHYGWDGKRANLIVSAVGNDTVEIVNSWKRVRTITGLETPAGRCLRAGHRPDRGIEPIGQAAFSTMRRPMRSSKPWILVQTPTLTTCVTIRYRGAFM